MHTVGNFLIWSVFGTIVIMMLIMEGLMHGRSGKTIPSIKQSALWAFLWMTLAMVFNALFWTYLLQNESRGVADSQALAFFTSYLLEKTLSIDNMFVWLMLFNYFSVPLALQPRILTLGILGAIGLRIIIVFAGTWLIQKFYWLLYVCGFFYCLLG